MSDSGKAVFLSYASQDAEAAKRICDALRTAGIEVWFDTDGGLDHGDEWDAKIRRQIKECVLFLPIISANTQAREEGYFRIEWELAAERAMGIAAGTAFILPIVIDDTREPAALVPDRFRKVQWTRLPGGTVPPDVKARFLKLWSHRTGAMKHEAVSRGQMTDDGGRPVPVKIAAPGWRVYAGLAAAVIALAAGAAWWMLRPGPAPAPAASTGAAPAPIAAPARPAREWPKDPELKKAFAIITGLDATVESCRLAEDMINAVLKQRPTDPEATTVYAMLNNYYINRGYDASEERQVLARRFSERALQLAPEEPEALAAMAQYLAFRGTDYARAEALIRKAMTLALEDPRFARILVYNVLRPTDPPRALAQAKEDAARFPRDPLTQYNLALIWRGTGDLRLMEEAIDRTLALTPLPSAVIWKGWLAAWMHGDLPGFKRWLDRISGNFRFSERAVYMHYLYACLSGDTAHGIEALEAFPVSWMNDFYYNGPRSLLLADLLTLAGKPELARVEYDRALAEIGRRAERDSQDTVWRAEFWALRGAGREADARAAAKRMMQRLNRPYRPPIMQWWHDVIPAQLLAGNRADALALIREAVLAPGVRVQIQTGLKIDQRMAPFRDDPEIQALLAEPVLKVQVMVPETGSSASIDQKSVAVLAFANLSDDKANEYFSDGISEELLNVLAKIPGLKVSARTSAFYFKGKEVPVPEIARQLGVAYVVEGSVRKQGDKVRITAQLIKAADGFHVWSDTFTRDLKDVFAVQDEIAGLIAKTLELKLGIGSAESRREVNPEAHRLVLEGRHFLAPRSAVGFEQAERAFTAALKLDPQFAPAQAGLASTTALRGRYRLLDGVGRVEEFDQRALAQSRRALQLDPTLAEPHATIGFIYTDIGRLGEAEQEFQLAIAANPNFATAYHWHSHVLAATGRLDLALLEIGRGEALDPVSFIILYIRGFYLLDARRYAEALVVLDRAAALRGETFLPLESDRARALLALGRKEEALATARQVLQDPRLITSGWYAAGEALYVLHLGGAADEAARLAPAILQALPAGSYQRGYVHCALGNFAEGLGELAHIPDIVQSRLYWHPMLESIHDTPQFRQLLEKLNAVAEFKVARATLARMLAEPAAGK